MSDGGSRRPRLGSAGRFTRLRHRWEIAVGGKAEEGTRAAGGACCEARFPLFGARRL
ncbi:hypothetical protein Sa4125_42630 [Aureimonas sp. SA4125]|nr:hypothetical protein Sa4125_42630 [Aureimonas sp. SA4125]